MQGLEHRKVECLRPHLHERPGASHDPGEQAELKRERALQPHAQTLESYPMCPHLVAHVSGLRRLRPISLLRLLGRAARRQRLWSARLARSPHLLLRHQRGRRTECRA